MNITESVHMDTCTIHLQWPSVACPSKLRPPRNAPWHAQACPTMYHIPLVHSNLQLRWLLHVVIYLTQYIIMERQTYRIAQKFRGSKFSRIAVFENFVEKISRIHCPKHATPTLFMGVTCWNSISRALKLSFIDLAAAVNTRNLEGMPTFNVQAMVRGYPAYQHVWAAACWSKLKQLRYLLQIWHERVLLERALLEDPATKTLDTVHPLFWSTET